MDGYKHYVRLDESNCIIHGFSNAFEQPQDGDILIVEDGPRHFHEAFSQPLHIDLGIPLWKLEGEQIVERSPEEVQQDIDALPPAPLTAEQRLELLELALDEIILGGGS